ncbi:MAG: hypothetical protein ACOC56_03920 [Atribacterota bacterium]
MTKLNAELNHKLHQDFKPYYFKKEFKEFLDKHNLHPTIFNLNCLFELGGVILTDAQVKNLRKLKQNLQDKV